MTSCGQEASGALTLALRMGLLGPLALGQLEVVMSGSASDMGVRSSQHASLHYLRCSLLLNKQV